MRSMIAAALTGLLISMGRSVRSQETTAPAPLDSLRQRARRDSNDAMAHYQLAMAYWDQKKWDDAELALREALLVAPSYPDAHLALGVLAQRRGDDYWKDRVKRDGEEKVRTALLEYAGHYRRAFLLNPMVDLRVLGKFDQEESGFYVVRGSLVFHFTPWWSHELTKSANEFREARYQKAFDRLQELMQDKRFGGEDVNVASPVLWLHGLAAAHLDNFDVAIRDFAVLTGRSLSVEQDSTSRIEGPLRSNDYRFILATMLYLAGRYNQAIPTFRRVLEIDLGLYAAHVQLARMHEAQGEIEDALKERRLALDVQQDDPDLLIDLAGTLLKAGRVPEAQEPLAQAAHLNPRDARVPFLQGAVAEQLHDTVAAEAAYHRFLAIAPSRFTAQIKDAGERLAGLSQPGRP
jgi:tetratricopeptide (TPR) repeat protein